MFCIYAICYFAVMGFRRLARWVAESRQWDELMDIRTWIVGFIYHAVYVAIFALIFRMMGMHGH